MQAIARPQRVSIETLTETDDGHGGFTQAWTPLRRRWSAAVKPLAGRDLERARQIDPRVSHQVTFGYWRAYQDDLNGGRVRLVYHPTAVSTADRTFEIVGPPIDDDEAHVQITVLCREAA